MLQHRYVVQRSLGEGGIGAAYLARDLLRETTVTLKLLRHIDPALIEAFRAEFMALRGVVHPHVCQVYDFGAVRADAAAPSYFYTAEYIDGLPLDRRVQGRTWKESSGLLAQALDGLRLLHGIGVLHGDFKPENILVSADDRAVLIDLSCSAPLGAPGGRAVSGTPGFIAPERMSEEPIEPRADLFAVGKTILSFSRSLREPLPAPVQALAERLASESPQERPADVNEVMEMLFADREAAPPSPPPPRLLGRSAELKVFQELLSNLISGRSGARCLLVCGPEGAGRTRLLQVI